MPVLRAPGRVVAASRELPAGGGEGAEPISAETRGGGSEPRNKSRNNPRNKASCYAGWDKFTVGWWDKFIGWDKFEPRAPEEGGRLT